MVSSLTLLALASGALALQVTSPTKSDVWTVGDSETITWDSVDSDQDTFNIYLSNMASYPTTSILLASDISTSDGSAKIDGSKLTAGNSFTINLTNGTKTEQIYAQSVKPVQHHRVHFLVFLLGLFVDVFLCVVLRNWFVFHHAFHLNVFLFRVILICGLFRVLCCIFLHLNFSRQDLFLHCIPSFYRNAARQIKAPVVPSTNSSPTASSTSSETGKSSSASATGTSSSDSTASSTGTSTKTSATKSSTPTSGAGKVVAGWMGLAAVAALAL
ncbi:hypothetical protein SLS53_006165 [Cytospora paraplurivora]|uniref:Yeast cell wall synthesis Kre9/Knh1-like N-terminal domain-containing protein n=1 Tax=Cytospora paraplurivora TaxID=2898453 RepID=A0AAN9U3K0_9PEZI